MSQAQRKKAGLLLVMIEVDPAYEEEFNRWYEEEHVPTRMACPGFVTGRRFLAVEGEPKYLALYELESLDALQTSEYQDASVKTDWWTAMLPHFVKIVRNTYVEMEARPAL